MDLKTLLRSPIFLAWTALIAATALSTVFGDGAGPAKLAAVVVIVVAFVKVRLVGAYFMELRGAPRILRVLFNGWSTVVPAILIGIYLIAG